MPFSLQEGHTDSIELKEDDELHVRAMIEYLYTFGYTVVENSGPYEAVCPGHSRDEDHTLDQRCILWPLGLSVVMYTMADKYDIDNLKNHACARFKKIIITIPEIGGWKIFLQAVKHAYHHSRPNDEMRNFITYLTVKLSTKWFSEEGYLQALGEMPDLYRALFQPFEDA